MVHDNPTTDLQTVFAIKEIFINERERREIAMCEMCHTRCGDIVHTKKGQVVKAKGDTIDR